MEAQRDTSPIVPQGRNVNSRGRQPTVRHANTFAPAEVAPFSHIPPWVDPHGCSHPAASRPRIWKRHPVVLRSSPNSETEFVAQTSQSAVSRVSKPADGWTSRAHRQWCIQPTWKSATQQVGKPALRPARRFVSTVGPIAHSERTDGRAVSLNCRQLFQS